MEKSFNCLLVKNTNETYDIPVSIFKDNDGRFTMFDNSKIKLNGLTVVLLRDHICKNKNIANYDDVKLWKVNVDEDKIKDVFTEDDIKTKLKGSQMKPRELFSKYFEAELDNKVEFTVTNIHIFSIIPATGKCLPTFYLSNKKFAVTKYRVCSDLFFSR